MRGKSDKPIKLKEGQNIARLDTIVTIILAGLKILIGLFSGSIVLITDSIHTASDSITRFASWFGLRIAQKKADKKFQYGYYKIETITTLFICIFMLYAGYESITESYSKLFIISKLNIPQWALGITIVSMILSFYISRREKEIGRKIDSQALVTLAQDSMLNILISFTVFIGITSTWFTIPYIEGAVSIIISLLIFKVGLENGKNALYSLMDASPNISIEKKVKNIIRSTKGVKRFEELRLRRAGPFIFGEVKIKVKEDLVVHRAHEISEEIEEKIKEQIDQIEYFSIHIEPFIPEMQTIVIPIDDKKGLQSKISDHFGRSKYLIYLDIKKDRIIAYNIKNNPYRKGKFRVGFTLIHETLIEKIDVLITRHIGAISFHALRDHLVDIYKTDKDNVEQTVKLFTLNKLKRLNEPTKKIGTENVKKEE